MAYLPKLICTEPFLLLGRCLIPGLELGCNDDDILRAMTPEQLEEEEEEERKKEREREREREGG